jgi:hypothetical protein
VQDYPGLWWSACSWTSHSVPIIISQHIRVLVEGLGEKPSSSASVFFFFLCYKKLGKFFPKNRKISKIYTRKKKKIPKFLVKKDTEVVGKSLLYTCKNFI